MSGLRLPEESHLEDKPFHDLSRIVACLLEGVLINEVLHWDCAYPLEIELCECLW